jgi:hypothetical protein
MRPVVPGQTGDVPEIAPGFPGIELLVTVIELDVVEQPLLFVTLTE